MKPNQLADHTVAVAVIVAVAVAVMDQFLIIINIQQIGLAAKEEKLLLL